jgi:hypothetical protein
MRFFLQTPRFALVLMTLFWTTCHAEAGFSVSVTVGGTTKSVSDNDNGLDKDGTTGSIDATLNVGNYSVHVVATTSSPGANGQGDVTQTSLTVRKTASSADSVIIEVVSDGFTFAEPGANVLLTNAVSSSLLLGDGNTATASATSSLDSSTTSAAALTGDINGTAQSANTSAIVSVTSNPFTLSNKLEITDLNVYNGNQNTDASIGVTTTAQHMPAPPSLALLASAVPLGGLLYLRRRRKKA